MNMYTEKSTLVSPGDEVGRDRYNQPILGPEKREEAPCGYTHRSPTEDTSTGEQYVTGYLVQWPPGYLGKVRGCDKVELPIGTYEVVGSPCTSLAGSWWKATSRPTWRR